MMEVHMFLAIACLVYNRGSNACILYAHISFHKDIMLMALLSNLTLIGISVFWRTLQYDLS